MLTISMENVLIALCNMSDEDRQDLKLERLALKANVSLNSVKRAIPVLKQHGLIAVHKRSEHGPDSLYSFAVTREAKFKANLIKHVQDYQNVPLSR